MRHTDRVEPVHVGQVAGWQATCGTCGASALFHTTEDVRRWLTDGHPSIQEIADLLGEIRQAMLLAADDPQRAAAQQRKQQVLAQIGAHDPKLAAELAKPTSPIRDLNLAPSGVDPHPQEETS